MRLFSKKSFEFTNPGTGEKAWVSPLAFIDVPDWVTADPLFDWAKSDGDLEIIQNTNDEKQAVRQAAGDPGPETEPDPIEPEPTAPGSEPAPEPEPEPKAPKKAGK